MGVVQTNSGVFDNTGTAALSFSTLPSAGSLIVVTVDVTGSAAAAVSAADNQGGTTYSLAKQGDCSVGYTLSSNIFYRENISAPSGTFTVTVTGTAGSYFNVGITEVAGAPTSSSLDSAAGSANNGTSGTISTGTGGATAQANAIVFVSAGAASGAANALFAAPSGYTQVAVSNDGVNHETGESAYKILSATGAQSASWTGIDYTGGSGNWAAVLAVFKLSSGGATANQYADDFGDYDSMIGGNDASFADHDSTVAMMTEQSAPVVPDAPTSIPVDDSSSMEWWNHYEEPLVSDFEWSGPIQPNAPPLDQFFDDIVATTSLFDDTTEEFFADDFGNVDADDVVIQDEWDWSEFADDDLSIDSYPVAGAAAAQPAAIEDAWDWSATELDTDDFQLIVDDDDDALQGGDTQYFGQEAELLDDATDDDWLLGAEYSQDVAVITSQVFDDAWDWTTDESDDVVADDYQLVDIVIPASKLFEDAGDHWTHDSHDELEFALGTDPVGADAPVTIQLADDPWPYFDEVGEEELRLDNEIGPDFVLVVSAIEDAWPHFDETVEDEAPTDALLADADPQAFDDAWNWDEDAAEEWQLVTDDDDDALQDAIASQLFDDAWQWDEQTDDDLIVDAILGATLVIPPSQFTDDAWDWTETLDVEDQVDQPILWGDVFAFFGGPRFIVRRTRMRLFQVARRYLRIFTRSALTNLRFPVKAPTESVPLTFDFTPDLLAGETLIGTPTIAFATVLGTDANPNALANGAAEIDATATKVIVPVDAGIDGCDYLITVTCATTNAQKILTLAAILPVRV